jgi:hypothetical protein
VPSEQGHGSKNVLACPDKTRETVIILDDPLVHVMGHGARTLTFSMACDLTLELYALLLHLEARVLALLLPCPQLL